MTTGIQIDVIIVKIVRKKNAIERKTIDFFALALYFLIESINKKLVSNGFVMLKNYLNIFLWRLQINHLFFHTFNMNFF